jgi:hypothetical protein
MAKSIFDIRKASPEKGKSYFFDANVWLMIIQGREKVEPYKRPYIDFFEALVTLSDACSGDNKPIIVVNTALISEAFNAFLRSEFDLYKERRLTEIGISQQEQRRIKEMGFKRDFRSLDEYDEAKSEFQSNMAAYWPYIQWLKEEDTGIDLERLIQQIPGNLDFNDYYYYEICIEKGYTFITNDRDFIVDGITILTCNQHILRNR